MNLLRRLLPGIALIIGTFLLSVGLQTFAFTEPSVGPTGGTVYAPLNTGSTTQTKSGNLTSSGTITGSTLNASTNLSLAGTSGITKVISQITGPLGAVTTNGANVTFSGAGVTQSGNTFTFSGGGSGGLSGSGTTNYISKWTGSTSLGTSNNIYDNDTNVGIGTASPSEKLHVNGSIYVGGNFYKAGNLNSVNNAIGVWSAEGGVISGFSSGKAVAMGQTTSGYIGLGITLGISPLATLHYDSNTSNVVLEAYGLGKNIMLATDYSNILFNTNGSNRMTITSGGNVGIGSGMSSPWAQLDVGGSIGQNGVAFRAMDNTFSKYLMIVPNLGLGGYSSASRAGDSGIFSAQGTGLVISPWNAGAGLRINQYGFVGIGLGGGAEPTYYLQLGSDSAGKPNGGSWGNSSDERLKRNINPLTGALGKITSLKGVQYEWKNPEEHASFSGEIRAGFIAQDVEKVFPQFINEIDASGKDKMLTPDGKIKSLTLPFDFDAYLVEAVKEQQKEIDSLKARIDALEKK